MPIKRTDYKGNVTVEFVGRVVQVVDGKEYRNVSDTLDYSDWQTVATTKALVYRGRWGKVNPWDKEEGVIDLPHRFQWVDCSSLYRDRGQDLLEPLVDKAGPAAFDDPLLFEDFLLWTALQEQEVANKRRLEEQRVESIRSAERELELHRAVVGKQMKVVSGRKVKPGTVGTVAFVGDGRVLLKKDAEWQDRKANGTWVDPRHLRAR